MVTTPFTEVPATDTLQPRLINATEYYRMAELGILKPDERVELLNGQIFMKFNFSKLRPITVEEYYQMAEGGILKPDEKLELINGQIIQKMTPQGSFHAAAISRANRILFGRFFPNALVRLQLPLTLGDASEPEPDIALVKVEPTDYDEHHPTAADTYLIIEVANSTLQSDLTDKNMLYAKAGIADYWVLDVKNRQLHVLRQPTDEGYQQITVLDETQAIAALAFPDVTIHVAEMLKPKSTDS